MLLDLSNILDQKKAKTYFEKLILKNVKIELKEVKSKRSISNNSYFHVVVGLYAIEFGYTLDEAKTQLKRLCGFMTYEKNGVKFLKKTSKLNDIELCDFTEWIRNKSANEGLYIPTPEEYIEHKFNIDKQIIRNKNYL